MITEIKWQQNSDYDYFNELLNLSLIYDAEAVLWEVWMEDQTVSVKPTLEAAKAAALEYINEKAGLWIKVGFKGDSLS